MSITVHLKKISNLPGKYDRKVELSFRGFTHKTKILQCENIAIFNEHFRWPHYGKIVKDEVLSVSVYNYSKMFSNRLLGRLVISLQHVVTAGRLVLREPLTDSNFSLTDIYIELDVRYQPVQGAVGTWDSEDFLSVEDNDDSGLVIRNPSFAEPGSKQTTRPQQLDRETRMIGRSLLRTAGGDDDEEDEDDDYEDDYDMADMEYANMTFTPILSRCRALSKHELAAAPKVQSFQVNVNVLEAQKLVGVNINPAVYVTVGGEKRHTATQKSTNCPFYNENFMFEFQETQDVLFDKVIEISVVHKKTLAFLMTRIGTFKIDISTVYHQPDHRFYQKWAPLTDPKDTRTGVKGYVKCTLSVVMKGDAMGMASLPPASSQNDDIEKNLLLPKRMPVERPWAKFLIKIYRAEGLPSMSAGFLGSFSKMMGDKKIFIDPYVQVTFAGQQGETSVISNSNVPEWNEQISFIEQFPPLARRIKVQILDDANIGDVAVATHFLDLQQISNPNRNGFHPTFGPSWINLYGSPQNSALRDIHRDLNEGLSEGIFYRGRLLLSLSVEVYSSPVAAVESKATDNVKSALSKFSIKRKSKKSKEKKKKSNEVAQGRSGPSEEPEDSSSEVPGAVTVEVEEIHPLPENFAGEKEEFLLFASLFEATMIDPSIGNKLVTFELSIGNYGKAADVVVKSKKGAGQGELGEDRQALLESSEDELEREDLLTAGTEGKSVTAPRAPQATEYDRSFNCIPLFREKPCIYVWNYFEDHSFRLCNCNWLSKMADRLEYGIDEVEKLLKRPKSNAKERFTEVLLEFVASCKQYSSNTDRKKHIRPNNLDKCRMQFIKRNIILLAKQALRVRRRVTRRTVKEKVGEAKRILKRTRFLAKEPQSTLPDVFLWMMSGGRRVAYARIPAHSILFSLVEEEKGKDCGKLTTVYMKTPGGLLGEIFAKLEVYLWLGITKYAKNCVTSLPAEFRPLHEEATTTAVIPTSVPPVKLQVEDRRYFQLRAHIYQARGIVAADDNGLSDPFVKVVFSTQCQVTRVMEETLSPTWCELLLYEQILMEGSKDDFKDDPPIVIINIYDYNRLGSPQSLGRAFAEPELKFVEEPYKKPTLKFFDIIKGKINAGELLAAFELIELDYSGFGEPCLPADVDPREPPYMSEERRYIIPDGVRPIMRKFRIEVLYWGVRDLRRVNLFEVEKPQVKMECAGQMIESEEIESYKQNPNFLKIVKHFDVDLPELVYLHPPLTIFVMEQRAFGRLVLVGTHVVQNLMQFAPKDLEEWKEEEEEPEVQERPPKKTTPLHTVMTMDLGGLPLKDTKIPINPINLVAGPLKKQRKKEEELEEEEPEKEELDWWSKYYASLAELEKYEEKEDELDDPQDAEGGNLNIGNIEAEDEDAVVVEIEPPKPKRKKIATLQLYKSELENEFSEFMDWLRTFPIYKGKSNDDEDDDDSERTMGKYKGSFLIYPISPEDEDAECQITNGIPKNTPIKVLVRVYVVKATNLAPTDPNGKADPYVVVKAGQQQMDSKERYIPKQLNPVFGEVFELTVSFPLETELTLMVFDHDIVGLDDLIGETRVDLENRFYSRHRAGCGLALYYDKDGYNKWRDAKKPTAILAELCRKNGIPSPEYRETEVKVLNKIFKIPNEAFPEELLKKNNKTEEDYEELDQHRALSVLRRWGEMREFSEGACPLVPEHVEVRCLHDPDKPGLPQGYVHMWIDMFTVDVPAPPPVNIKPRLPISYELRVIIWNTDDVVLDDVNPFTGEPSSDIYVKGWIKGLEHDKQETDVHFNSLTGEGNFNWRFIFRFDYLPTEKEIIYKRKETIFSLEESEFRQPAVLVLQVWDYDRIAANDFLGSIELRLSDMVRAAKSSEQCSIKMAKDKASPRFSIFRSKRMKGWWPLIKLKSQEDIEREAREAEQEKKNKKKKKKKRSKRSKMKPEDLQFVDSSGNTFLLMGKVEAEFQLLTAEEAEKNPVGKARKEPEPLEKPNRPKTSFNWFVNPMKTFVFFIWKKYKKYIIVFIILAILTLFLFLILYTLPTHISQLIVNG
ncbi:LOW QUALITY PROTEIN: fer-1-like protein 4 [Chanos chanos]|uniref:LOW QUALITY PROTEIN: fer-1-like protein 4 n=1 Tax=Chanos chanos TaxID=29144 RepID=A0A6J2VJ81_CHACN|nr:LOW QUALITY PROTEIN: fer-1-like protein 4 [Chanos chanos]